MCRCPLHITLAENNAPNAQWICRVSLQKKHFWLEHSEWKKRTHLLGPWDPCDMEDIPFKTVYNKEEVEQVLNWAQVATLNPGISPDDFVPGMGIRHLSKNYDRQVDFSPNVVALEISGPDLPSLSFFDLPGIIQVTEGEHDKYLIKVVETLVTQYVKHENALILCALPMSSDSANSRASRIVRDCQAADRCLGVLTKPDLLKPAELMLEMERIWAPMLRGEKYPFGHGYFVTKQLAQSDLFAGLTDVVAREREAEFFGQQPPWSTDLREFHERFGTRQLQNRLSEMLGGQIIQK